MGNTRKAESVVLFASLLLWVAYFVDLILAYPQLLESVGQSHLALIDVVFPYLNVIGLSLGLLCLVCTVRRIENQYLQLTLLIQLATVLWLTPYFLSGYIYNHDSLYHGGVSLSAAQILGGQPTYFSAYLENYPMSYVFNWIFVNATGVGFSTYGRLVFPTLAVIISISLMYCFASQLFGSRVGFFSIVLTVLGLYYVEFHIAPQTIGVLLVLTAIFLLNRIDRKSKILAMLPVLVLIGTHPESPMLLAVFLIAALIAGRITRDRSGSGLYSASYLMLILVCWLAWAFFDALSVGGVSISQAVSRLLTFTLSFDASSTLKPTGTLFPVIGDLRTYFLYGFTLIYAGFLLTFLDRRVKYSVRRTLTRIILEVNGTRIMLIVGSVLFLIAGFALRTATAEAGINLVQRALFYYYLCIGIVIASGFVRIIDRNRSRASLLLILLVGCWIGGTAFAYPIASYYDNAYSNVSYSQVAGLQFLGQTAAVGSSPVFSYWPLDLAFVTNAKSIQFVDLPQDRSAPALQQFFSRSANITIIQHDKYFYYADQDLSLNNNTYTQVNAALIQSTAMNKVYSNPSCDIYVNDE